MAPVLVSRYRLLVVGGDTDSNALVAYHLAAAGYGVTTEATGHQALETARADTPTLIVLDTGLRDMSGFDLLTELRRCDETQQIGILVLTERKQSDLIKALSLGADDCVGKPFVPEELLLRVRAIVRRVASSWAQPRRRLTAGPLTLDEGTHAVHGAGVEVELTTTEFKLLTALLRQPGRVQSRAQLLETVWRSPLGIRTRTMDMHVQRLRRKLGSMGTCIETVRGAGYRLRVIKGSGFGLPSLRAM